MSSIVKIAPSASIVYQYVWYFCVTGQFVFVIRRCICALASGILFNLKTVKSQGIYSVKCQFRGSLKGGNATFFTVFPFYKGGLSTLENWGKNKGYLSSQRSPGESPDIQCFAEFDASQRNFKFAQVVKSNSNSPLTTSRKV